MFSNTKVTLADAVSLGLAVSPLLDNLLSDLPNEDVETMSLPQTFLAAFSIVTPINRMRYSDQTKVASWNVLMGSVAGLVSISQIGTEHDDFYNSVLLAWGGKTLLSGLLDLFIPDEVHAHGP